MDWKKKMNWMTIKNKHENKCFYPRKYHNWFSNRNHLKYQQKKVINIPTLKTEANFFKNVQNKAFILKEDIFKSINVEIKNDYKNEKDKI